jgi:RNA polymerase sigma-70 factor (ECF subfamily)
MDAHATTMGPVTRQRQDEFHALLEAHRRIVFKVAGTYARLPEDRADLAQEIAAQLWRAFPGFDAARSAFSTWMYRIALNVAISQVRSHGLRRGVVESLEDAHLEVAGDDGRGIEDADAGRVLQRLIAGLEPLDRALLLLYLDERPQREIAEVLGISETNVATKIGRLKQRLRQQMAGTQDGSDTHGTR